MKAKVKSYNGKLKTVKLFCCGTLWHHELGEKSTGGELYSTLGKLKANVKCLDECGIIELTVTGRVIKKGSL